MDRRYSGMRFYNGVKASNKTVDQREALLGRYMSNIKATARKAENYGGSTGGRKSLEGRRTGTRVIQQRQAKQADNRKIFDQQGTGRFGARKESWIGKQFDPEQRKAMIDRQFSKDRDDFDDEPKADSTGLDSTGLSGLSGGTYSAY